MGASNPRRVLLIVENSLLREGLRRMLEGRAELELVGAVRDLSEARALAHTKTPDVVIVERETTDAEPAQVWPFTGDAESRVITVTLRDCSLRVYTRRSIPGATVEDLLEAMRRAV